MNKIVVYLIRLYKASSTIIWTYRPAIIIYSACRFCPTCSEYAQEAVQKHGITTGLIMGLRRLCRCNPFSKSGYDPVR